MICFNPVRGVAYVNSASLKHYPNVDYVRFLISPHEKLLCLYPCNGNEKNAIRMRSKSRLSIRYIRCEEFIHRLIIFAQWNGSCRYILGGSITEIGNKSVITFNLTGEAKIT